MESKKPNDRHNTGSWDQRNTTNVNENHTNPTDGRTNNSSSNTTNNVTNVLQQTAKATVSGLNDLPYRGTKFFTSD